MGVLRPQHDGAEIIGATGRRDRFAIVNRAEDDSSGYARAANWDWIPSCAVRTPVRDSSAFRPKTVRLKAAEKIATDQGTFGEGASRIHPSRGRRASPLRILAGLGVPRKKHHRCIGTYRRPPCPLPLSLVCWWMVEHHDEIIAAAAGECRPLTARASQAGLTPPAPELRSLPDDTSRGGRGRTEPRFSRSGDA